MMNFDTLTRPAELFHKQKVKFAIDKDGLSESSDLWPNFQDLSEPTVNPWEDLLAPVGGSPYLANF